MIRALAFAALLALTTPIAAAAESPTVRIDSGQDAVVQAFFKELQGGRTPAAYQGLFGSAMMIKKQVEVENLIAQTNNAMNLFGKVSGWELVTADEISPSYGQAVYALKTETLPLFFKFEFYRNTTRRTVTRMDFTDSYKTTMAK